MCEPTTITMIVIAVATAVKASMDAKKAASIQRKNAIAQQAIEQEAMLKKRAELGDKNAMEAFEKSRAARVDQARIQVAAGEKGASTGNFQTDTMLQGLGFGTGLQRVSDQRSADSEQSANDLQLRASGISFTNSMRTINASDPNGFTTLLNAGAAGANAYAQNKPAGAHPGGGSTGRTSGIDPNAQSRRGV